MMHHELKMAEAVLGLCSHAGTSIPKFPCIVHAMLTRMAVAVVFFLTKKNCQLVLSEGFPCLSHLIPENLRRMRLGDGNNPWPHIGNFYAINPWNPMESQRLSIPFGRALRDRQWRWSHGGCDCRHRGALNWTGSNMIQYWICSWKFGKPVIQAYLNDSLRGRVKPESLGISFSSQVAILRHGIKRRWFQYKVRTCPGMLS